MLRSAYTASSVYCWNQRREVLLDRRVQRLRVRHGEVAPKEVVAVGGVAAVAELCGDVAAQREQLEEDRARLLVELRRVGVVEADVFLVILRRDGDDLLMV